MAGNCGTCGQRGCVTSGCCSACGTNDTLIRIENPNGFLTCGEDTQLTVVNAVGAVVWTLVPPTPVGVTITPGGLLTIPPLTVGIVKVRVTDSQNNVANMAFSIFCPPADCDDPCRTNRQTCSIIVRLNGCAPFTITDSLGRTYTVTNDKDYHFLSFGN